MIRDSNNSVSNDIAIITINPSYIWIDPFDTNEYDLYRIIPLENVLIIILLFLMIILIIFFVLEFRMDQ